MARAKISAGLLVHRHAAAGLEVLIAHPGGPLFARKDAGAWTVPKGELAEGEEPLAAAKREFQEESGSPPPDGEYLDLGTVKQRGGKLVRVWAVAGDWDVTTLRSNTFLLEWPPRSGRQQAFPEVDRMQFVDLATAREKLNPAQVELLDRLVALLPPG